MATVIDSLVVMLGLDTSKFRQGQKQNQEDLKKSEENANSTAKAIEYSGRTAAQFFSRLRNEALLLFAAFTGANGVKQFVENITNSDANMSRLSKQLDMSTDELTTWTNAAKLTGGSAETMAGTFQNLEGHIQNFIATGRDSLIPMFRSIGVAAVTMGDDGQLHARPLRDILLDIAKWAEGKDPAYVAERLRQMGFDQTTITMILKGRAGLEQLLDTAHKLGTTTDQEGKNAEELQKAWTALGIAATSLGRTILNDLSPYVIGVLNQMVDWAAKNREWIDTKIHEAIQFVIDKAKELYQYLSTADWQAVWTGIVAGVTQIQLQFEAWFKYLQEHWPEIQQGAKQVADDLGTVKDVVLGIKDAVGGWKNVAEILLGVWAIGKFAPIIGGLTAILRLLGAVTVASRGAATGGLLGGMLGKAALAAVVAELGVTAVDPDDKIGTWVDKNIPGAGYLDDLSARYLGLGRTFEQQDQAAQAAGYGSGVARGIRNNNPLNLEYRPGQGAASSDGRFGVYSNMEGGIAAASRQLLLYQDRDHLNTIRSIISKWAPPSDKNDTAGYINQVSGMLHVDPDTQLDLHDQNMMSALIIAMAKRESGAKLSPDTVMRGVTQTMPPAAPQVSEVGPRVPRSLVSDLNMGAAASPAVTNNATNTTNNTTSDVRIGTMNIQTQATDAPSIAGGIAPALQRSMTVQQANSGLN